MWNTYVTYYSRSAHYARRAKVGILGLELDFFQSGRGFPIIRGVISQNLLVGLEKKKFFFGDSFLFFKHSLTFVHQNIGLELETSPKQGRTSQELGPDWAQIMKEVRPRLGGLRPAILRAVIYY